MVCKREHKTLKQADFGRSRLELKPALLLFAMSLFQTNFRRFVAVADEATESFSRLQVSLTTSQVVTGSY